MSHQELRALGRVIETYVPPGAFVAKVTRDVTDETELVDVKLVQTDDLEQLASEQAPWPAKGSLPQRDDECLVIYDHTGRPWVVAWNEPGWGAT